jgi:RNA polymerase sigma-70 factor, ECF subfamily
MALADQLDHAATTFSGLRRRLFGIAYRMLGSAAEAEDVVQETWLRWQATDRSVVRDAGAFLATTTARLAINSAQSARSRRETYVGQWLPEPVDTSSDPELGAERGEALEFGVLRLLEALTPAERAAYVLKEAFDYSYAQIAEVLNVQEANARQLASRARKHLSSERREEVSAAEYETLLDAFLNAARTGDRAALENLFAEDVVSYADGGGFVAAARRPVVGRQSVARFFSRTPSWFWEGAEITWIEANGRPAAVLSREGVDFAVVAIRTSKRGVEQIMWQMNPTKLAAISRSSRGTNAPV